MVAGLPPGRLPLWAVDGTTFLPVLYLAAALIVGAVLIALAQRWRRSTTSPSPGVSASDQMAEFNKLYERGAMSKEEFEKVRAKLFREIRQASDLPPVPPPTAAPAVPPAAPPADTAVQPPAPPPETARQPSEPPPAADQQPPASGPAPT
jgi:hypothetical protein